LAAINERGNHLGICAFAYSRRWPGCVGEVACAATQPRCIAAVVDDAQLADLTICL